MSIDIPVESAQLLPKLWKENRMSWQACVYCTHMTVGDVNWCSEHERTYADSTIRGGNRCKDFEFNEINAENPDHTYQPHWQNCPDPRQMRMEVDA